jgi:hypothetical protein
MNGPSAPEGLGHDMATLPTAVACAQPHLLNAQGSGLFAKLCLAVAQDGTGPLKHGGRGRSVQTADSWRKLPRRSQLVMNSKMSVQDISATHDEAPVGPRFSRMNWISPHILFGRRTGNLTLNPGKEECQVTPTGLRQAPEVNTLQTLGRIAVNGCV